MTPLEVLAWLGVFLVGLMVLTAVVVVVAAVVIAVRRTSKD